MENVEKTVSLSLRREFRYAAMLFLTIAAAYSIGMSRAGFEGKDERRYAQVAKELGPGKRLFVLHYLGGLYPDKPPLVFWSERLSFAILGGVSPFAARIPLFLSAMAALFFSYALMRQLDGPRRALLGTACLSLCFRFIWESRWVKLDLPMCAFTYAAYWASVRILFPKEGQSRAGWGWAMGAWTFAALAVLAKGPGAATWLLTIVVFAGLRRDRAILASHRPLAGMAWLLALVGAWFVPAALWGGPEYYRPMLGVQVVQRYFGEIRHQQPFIYFVPKLFSDSLPASLLLPAGLWAAWRSRRDGRTAFLLTWFLLTFAFFSIPAGKRGQYVLPLYPAACLLIARLLDAALLEPESGPGRVVRRHLWFLATLLLLAAVAFWRERHDIGERLGAPLPHGVAVGVPIAVAIGGAGAALGLLRGRLACAAAFPAFSIYLVYAILFGVYFPIVHDDAIPREVARHAGSLGANGDKLGLLGIDDRFTLYGEGLPTILGSWDEAESFMKSPGSFLAASRKEYQQYMQRRRDPPWPQEKRWRYPDRKDAVILLRGGPSAAAPTGQDPNEEES